MGAGKAIRRIRREKELSQEWLGEQTGLTSASISRIESEQTNPSEETLRRIAKALDVSVKAFFEEEEKQTVRILGAGPGSEMMGVNEEGAVYNKPRGADMVPFLGTIVADPSGKEFFEEDDVPAGAMVPFFKGRNHNNLFALEVESNSLMTAEPVPILPGEICIFDKNREPKPGHIVAVQLLQSNLRMVKILYRESVDSVELRSANKYVVYPHVTLKKDQIASFAVFVGKVFITDELKREYGLRK